MTSPKVAYSAAHYDVIVTESPDKELRELGLKTYGIINREHGVIEAYRGYLADAIALAQHISDALERPRDAAHIAPAGKAN